MICVKGFKLIDWVIGDSLSAKKEFDQPKLGLETWGLVLDAK